MNGPPSSHPAAAPVRLTQPVAGPGVLDELSDALATGWLTTGPRVARFEDAVGRRLGPDVHAAGVASCTDALRLALRARGIGPGDEVITSTWTFSATAEAIASVGATPVLVDVTAGSLNIDPEAVAAAITPRTAALLPVHFAGLPVPMDALDRLAADHGLHVIEDAAHAFGAARRGVPIGARPGTIACFSFHATKNLSCGEGGLLATDDAELADRVRSWRRHARRGGVDPARPWRYDIVDRGDKCNLSDVHAALGLAGLQRFDADQARRAALAQRYRRGLADLPVDLPPEAPAGDRHGLHLFVIQVRDEAALDRDALYRALDARAIETSVHFWPLHRMSHWRATLRGPEGRFPVADAAAERVLSLPFHAGLTDADQDRVIAALASLLTP
mgnify:CR=1 FL=1